MAKRFSFQWQKWNVGRDLNWWVLIEKGHNRRTGNMNTIFHVSARPYCRVPRASTNEEETRYLWVSISSRSTAVYLSKKMPWPCKACYTVHKSSCAVDHRALRFIEPQDLSPHQDYCTSKTYVSNKLKPTPRPEKNLSYWEITGQQDNWGFCKWHEDVSCSIYKLWRTRKKQGYNSRYILRLAE